MSVTCNDEEGPFNYTYTGPCPRGCICDEKDEDYPLFPCSDILKRWEPLLDGAYCAYNSTSIENCPIGSYCPDASTKLNCPKGYFCPHKTKAPEISCRRCEEGAIELERELFGYFVFIIFWASLILYVLYDKILRSRLETQAHRQKLQDRLINEKREEQIKKMNRKRMERLSPMIDSIFKRLDAGKTHEKSNGANSSEIAEKLFDAIDVDDDGDLSYAELNKALDLKSNRLKEFVKMMNHRAGQPAGTDHISKEIFVNHFYDTIEQVAKYDPTPEECEQLYENIALIQFNDSDAATIDLNGLFDTDLKYFLTSKQIFTIVKNLKEVHELSQGSLINKDDTLPGEIRPSSLRMTVVNTVKGQSTRSEARSNQSSRSRDKRARISKKAFTQQYPLALYSVLTGESDNIPRGVDIAFEDLCLEVNVGGYKNRVLDKVTGRLQGKTMTALMGGSGAGKTSLLNALCGRAFYGEVSGSLFINGHETTIEEHLDMVGFVPQDDIVYAELTVRENLIYAGRFRLPKSTSLQKIEDIAEEVMADLGLTNVADNIVGDVTRRGVSGGEKKRVSIGLELMANPSILFLDEPTSGLDATSAMLVMQGLRNLVQRKGVTICSVIHQPRKDIFELFDSLILLGVGGRMVYHGQVNEVKSYFDKLGFKLPDGESVADWLIDISSGRLDVTPVNSLGPSVFNHQPEALNLKPVEEPNDDKANLNRLRLYRSWAQHFKDLDNRKRKAYKPPDKYDLPVSKEKKSFSIQVFYHLKRNFLVQKRNLPTKLIDTIIISVASIAICLLKGKLVLTRDMNPNFRNEYEILTSMDELYLADNREEIVRGIFDYSLFIQDFNLYAAAMGMVVCTLLAIIASKVLTEKRLELFREAGSGYNLTAYYLAVNVSSTIEHTIQIILIGVSVVWLRCTVTSEFCSYLSFVLMAWVATSWALFFPLFVPPKNVVVVIGFSTLFFCSLYGGTTPPALFEDIYSNKFIEIIAGIFSASRFYTETLIVSELRALPPQSGYTLSEEIRENAGAAGISDSDEVNCFNILGLAQYDIDNVSIQSSSGWYQQMLAPFLVGLTIRFLGVLLLHIFNRSKQAKASIVAEMKRSLSYCLEILVLICFFILSLMLSLWQIGIFN